MPHPRRTRKLLPGLIAAFVLLPMPVRADLIISEICDPRLNYASDRFIEVFNTGDQALDLTGWKLVAVANSVDAFAWNLSGLIDARQALVAGDATTVDAFVVDFPDEAWSGANGNWNGKVGDGARLEDPSGTVIDRMVAAGTAFENADYVRNEDVTVPSPTSDPSQWRATPVDLASQGSPGSHQLDAPSQGPAISGIATDPAWPSAGDAVHVVAVVTDQASAVTGADVLWGTAPTLLAERIAMADQGGGLYRTVDPIPAQAGGSTVFFRVEAENAIPATTTSDLHQYALPWSLTIAQIQGAGAASPYDGAMATTQGVVTGVFGTLFALQDGTGPRSGLWVRAASAPALGDLLTVTGLVTESSAAADLGNTMVMNAAIISSLPGGAVPAPAVLGTSACGQEDWEGVLVQAVPADCVDPDLGGGEWALDDGSGSCRVGVLGQIPAPILGTTYRVTGPVAFNNGNFKLEPRGATDVAWLADIAAPVLLRVLPLDETSLRAVFSETVDPTSAGDPARYAIPGLTVLAAARDGARPAQVLLTVSTMAAGSYTLTVTGVADLFGNGSAGSSAGFSCLDPGYPAGYYDAAVGLTGPDLQTALHEIINDHTVRSYDFAWTAYYTTDVRPDNHKVWDIYSDIPGGVPPYLYDFGIDEGGIGGAEGTGYTREHTWCKSWFGGEVSPMYSDLFTLFPCDTHINGTRGVYPYGETAAPFFVSLNGSEVGPSVVPGYGGTVFEPRDDFKGDLARAYLYFSTRYLGEDTGWPGGPATVGATILPWALDLYLVWVDEDPVSQKEIDRNNAIYAIQGNRNPFVDRPEYAALVFGGDASGVPGTNPGEAPKATARNLRASPNPFNPSTVISYELEAASPVVLEIYDLGGRLVRRLEDGRVRAPGRHEIEWDGKDRAGSSAASGAYLCRLEAGTATLRVKLALLK